MSSHPSDEPRPRRYPITGQPRKNRSSFVDLTGRTFGRWSVLSEIPKTRPGQTRWLCRCTCGTEKTVIYGSLVRHESQSCGCLKRERTAALTKPLHERHNRGNPTWRAWRYWLTRMSPEWHTFGRFLADMGPRPEGTRLRRRDTAKPFDRENCYWG